MVWTKVMWSPFPWGSQQKKHKIRSPIINVKGYSNIKSEGQEKFCPANDVLLMVQKSQTTTGWMVLKPWKSWHFNYHYLNWLYSRVSGCHQLHLPFFCLCFFSPPPLTCFAKGTWGTNFGEASKGKPHMRAVCWRNVDVRVGNCTADFQGTMCTGKGTLPETNIAPENRPSRKETGIPTIHFQVRTVSFREGRSNSHFDGCLLVENNFVSDVIHISNCSLKLHMPETSMRKTTSRCNPRTSSGWWFQPIWKILVKMGIFPN